MHETAAVVQVAFPRFNFNVAILFACDRTQAESKSKRGGKEVGWKKRGESGREGKGRVGEVERKGGNVKRKETVDGGKERAKEKKEGEEGWWSKSAWHRQMRGTF